MVLGVASVERCCQTRDRQYNMTTTLTWHCSSSSYEEYCGGASNKSSGGGVLIRDAASLRYKMMTCSDDNEQQWWKMTMMKDDDDDDNFVENEKIYDIRHKNSEIMLLRGRWRCEMITEFGCYHTFGFITFIFILHVFHSLKSIGWWWCSISKTITSYYDNYLRVYDWLRVVTPWVSPKGLWNWNKGKLVVVVQLDHFFFVCDGIIR